MASSVSSECAFSSAGITLSKRRNRLQGDVVEALQFLKCAFNANLIFRKVSTLAEEEEPEGTVLDCDGSTDCSDICESDTEM